MIRKKIVILLIAIAAAVIVRAAIPQFRLFATAEDMEKGKSLGASIDVYGGLSLAPETMSLHRANMPMFWCLATDAQGNILAGGGNPGQLLSLKPGPATSAGEATTLFSAQEFAVFCVLPREKDIYFSTSPDGQIYRLDANRKAQPFFKPEAKYTWAMAVDAKGLIYAATGSPARLYSIDGNGQGRVIFECDEPHLRSLAIAESGWLFLGSSGSGYIYRMRPDGSEVSVLYDAPMDEILQVLPASDGTVYAAAAGQPGGAPAGGPAPSGEALAQDDEQPLQEAPSGPGRSEDEPLSQLLLPGGAKAKSGLYRILPNGHVKDLWSARSDRIHSAVLEKDGTLLVGTGDRGRLYRMAKDGSTTLVVELETPQLTALSADRQGNVLIAGSNPGTITLLRNHLRSAGEYRSDVIDAKVPARWGAISWEQEGGGLAKFSTRSGNTGKPDKTWSAWQDVESQVRGGGIASPGGRFLQWRVELTGKDGDSPRVKRVQVSFLQENVSPEVTQITVHSPGDYFPDAVKSADDEDKGETNGRATNNQSPGRKTFQKGAQSVSWQARDDNNDRLQFSLFYRMTGESTSASLGAKTKQETTQGWREMAKNLQATAYSWDSQTMPDGEYQMRIVASDAKSNTPATEASGEKISDPFIVDNTPPAIERLAAKVVGRELEVSFSAVDAFNRLKEAWYVVDTGEWKSLHPRDGVIDQRQEEFTIKMAALTGLHSLTVKVSDAAGNIGFGRTSIGEK